MIEALKSDEIVNKVGGRFKLTALIQKRMLELMDGARPLVERGNMTDLEVVDPGNPAGQDRHRLCRQRPGSAWADPDAQEHAPAIEHIAEGREIVVAVCGGIAAYKVADLVSRLTQLGAGVTSVMTAEAQKFVTPLTFATLSGRPVLTGTFN